MSDQFPENDGAEYTEHMTDGDMTTSTPITPLNGLIQYPAVDKIGDYTRQIPGRNGPVRH